MLQLGAARYTDQIHNTCVNEYLMLDGGASYFDNLYNSFCLLPGNYVRIHQILTRPQFCDKVLTVGPSRLVQKGRPVPHYLNSRHLAPLTTRANDLRSRVTVNANQFASAPYTPNGKSEIGKTTITTMLSLIIM